MNYKLKWHHAQSLKTHSYDCHFCGHKVAADKGWFAETETTSRQAFVFICPNCKRPTFFDADGEQVPSPRVGGDVKGITDKGVESLYNEARDCMMVGAHTAAALLARKLLMNIAVQHGAAAGRTFAEYVDHLATNGFVPPNGKPWVDQLRTKGNEATHEIHQTSQADARQVLTFAEMLLRFVYEFPSMVGPSRKP